MDNRQPIFLIGGKLIEELPRAELEEAFIEIAMRLYALQEMFEYYQAAEECRRGGKPH